jgi:hypothetical protein
VPDGAITVEEQVAVLPEIVKFAVMRSIFVQSGIIPIGVLVDCVAETGIGTALNISTNTSRKQKPFLLALNLITPSQCYLGLYHNNNRKGVSLSYYLKIF